jgi:CheY-like chemotaxis protein
MPGLDIERLVDAIRSGKWRKIPIVLFTTSMEVEAIAEAIGAAAIVEKPFRPDELKHTIQKVAERASA